MILKSFTYAAIAASLVSLSHNGWAGSFELAIGPSRFEISGKSGQRIGQSLEMHNLGAGSSEVSVRTIDWQFSADGKISYFDALQPGSCRPWVTLERRTVKINTRANTRFRFQIDVPPNAEKGECQFMLAIEGIEPAHQAQLGSAGASLALPVTGRIAVPVYLAINGAQPKLELDGLTLSKTTGKPTVMATVRNTGQAHGRLEGSLEAVDANGQEIKLAPEGTPIMAGQTRILPFTATLASNNKSIDLALPLQVKGTLDWDRGGFKVEAILK